MSALFGSEAPTDKTVLIVDIENSSVGCALVRASSNKAPKLFAEKRIPLPLLRSISADKLLAHTDKALREAFMHVSTTAARMRHHEKLAPVGVIDSVVVFVAAPWATAQGRQQGLAWRIEPLLINHISAAIIDTFGPLNTTFHATSAATSHATNQLFEIAPDLLISTIGGEVTELTLLQNGVRIAHATMPLGKHFLLRTLQTHAGLSVHEAHSAIRLARTSPIETPHDEALLAAAAHFAREFGHAASTIVETPVAGVLVIAHEPIGEWAARSIATHDIGNVFAEGTQVQALHTHHIGPHLGAHAIRPDLIFMVEALFIGTHPGVVN